MKIFVFGSHYGNDGLAIEIAEALERDRDTRSDIEFLYDTDPLSLVNEKEITILDTAKGIDAPVMFDDISKLMTGKVVSMHDVDLSYVLQLFEKLGLDIKYRIIAVPLGSRVDEMLEPVRELLMRKH